MVLADTSVWIQHFRQGDPALAEYLSAGLIIIHPFITGELACGNFKNRTVVLSHLNTLPAAPLASNAEVLHLLEERRLWGQGLGWIDLHLLASALLSQCRLWTLDLRLRDAAAKISLSQPAIQPPAIAPTTR